MVHSMKLTQKKLFAGRVGGGRRHILRGEGEGKEGVSCKTRLCRRQRGKGWGREIGSLRVFELAIPSGRE